MRSWEIIGEGHSVEGTNIKAIMPDKASEEHCESREAGQRLIPGPQEKITSSMLDETGGEFPQPSPMP